MKKLTLTLATVALMGFAGNAQSLQHDQKKDQGAKHESVNPDGTAATVDNGQKSNNQSPEQKAQTPSSASVKEAPANKDKATPAKKESPATKPAAKKPAGTSAKK